MGAGYLSVDVQALVSHASSRYEDALICEALRSFLLFAGDVPTFAWGSMEWSGRWARDWASALDCRVDEAATARDVQAETAAVLAKVAADYANADITCAWTFQDIAAANDFFKPWLTDGGQRAITVHPGSSPIVPDYPHGTPHPSIPHGDLKNPDDLKTRVSFAGSDHLVNSPWIESRGVVSDRDMMFRTLGDTPGRRRLLEFVRENGGHLRQAERIVSQLGLASEKLPMDGFINEAITAWPGIITNRAELVNAVSAEWDERRADMSAQTNALADYWSSPGAATAYLNHANRCITYYTALRDQAAWLGGQGKNAAQAIDDLQLAYANTGYAHIDNLITKLEAYLDAADSWTDSLDSPAKALAGALSAMAAGMLANWREVNDNAASTLQIAQVAHDNAPDLGDATHRTQPFPSEHGLPDYGDAGGWKPNQGGPPGIVS
jgi:hypothetical protein